MDLSDLNEEQRRAATAPVGPVLVLAGAGSGKTRVITYRIAWLLDRGVDAGSIAAVTFTNKAAGEMKERVRKLVGASRAKGLHVSTFHALGLLILRRGARRLDLRPDFAVYDAGDQLDLVRTCLRSLVLPGQEYDARLVQSIISRWKNDFRTPETAEPRERDDHELIAAEVFKHYERGLRNFAALDFDDLIVRPTLLLENDREFAGAFKERTRHLLVDEYQDTNAAQFRLVRALAGPERSVFVVGDDDQSIYGWRGAEIENILSFDEHFEGAEVCRLERNYRSTGTILKAANAVVKNNRRRREKSLWTSGEEGGAVELFRALDPEEEATHAAGRIAQEVFEKRARFDDFGVLYRTNAQSRPLEEALRAENVPYVVVGGMQFYDRKEVKDLLAYLKLLANPRDDIAFLRIVNYPPRGMGPQSVENLSRFARDHGLVLTEAARQGGLAELNPRAAGALKELAALIAELRGRLERGEPLAPVTRDLVERTGMYVELRSRAKDALQGSARIENVEELLRGIERYWRQAEGPSLAGFLERISLMNRTEESGEEDVRGKTILMTLHSAKGLEFPYLFIVGCEEGLTPHKRSAAEGLGALEEDGDLEEERRLFYVGLTRARRRLTLSWRRTVVRYGQEERRRPSRFLAEIPEELILDITEKEAASPEECAAAADAALALIREMASKK